MVDERRDTGTGRSWRSERGGEKGTEVEEIGKGERSRGGKGAWTGVEGSRKEGVR